MRPFFFFLTGRTFYINDSFLYTSRTFAQPRDLLIVNKLSQPLIINAITHLAFQRVGVFSNSSTGLHLSEIKHIILSLVVVDDDDDDDNDDSDDDDDDDD